MIELAAAQSARNHCARIPGSRSSSGTVAASASGESESKEYSQTDLISHFLMMRAVDGNVPRNVKQSTADAMVAIQSQSPSKMLLTQSYPDGFNASNRPIVILDSGANRAITSYLWPLETQPSVIPVDHGQFLTYDK